MSTVKDKATAFKNEISGSHTNKIICKAASHELAGPKKKHVDFLLQLTNNPKCQFITLVDLISERLKHSSWVVVFKGLILCHNLMSLGNEKFLQCVATKGHMFDLDDFTDKSDVIGTDMSSYLRKYARYIRHVCISYKAVAMDICRIPRGEESPYKTMEVTKLLKSATVIQDQLDILLEVEFNSTDLSNGVINTSFLMLYKDLIKLYTVYNDAVINLLEKFFEMKKSDCKETIGYYRRFLIRQETIQNFLQLAEDVGVDKDTHLNLRQVPEDLLPALEAHLTDMDAIKKASGAQPSPQIQAASERLQELREKEQPMTKTSSQSTSMLLRGLPSASEEVLEAQRKRFEELKKRAKLSPSASSTDSNTLTKSTASVTAIAPPPQTATSSAGAVDLLGLDTSSSSNSSSQPTNFSPWANSGGPATNSIPPAQQATNSSYNPFGTPNSSSTNSGTGGGQPSSSVVDPWNGGVQPDGVASSYQEVDLFSEIRGGPDFDNVFGGNKPQSSTAVTPAVSRSTGVGGSLNQFQIMGGILMPQTVGTQAQNLGQGSPTQSQQGAQGLTKDVESSLARAAANLSVDAHASVPKTGMPKKIDYQWSAPKESIKTGGPNWQRQNLQPKTLPPGENKSADWSGGAQAGHFPLNNSMQPGPSMMAGGGMIAQPPMMMGPRQPMTMGGGMQQMSRGGMMMSGGMYPQQQVMMGQPFMQQQQQQQPGGMQAAGVWPQQQQQQFQQNRNPFGQNAPLF